ncbi:MAG: MBL fold metallo-hydrolase, partial [Bacteroidetes bacterium]|nr:MBL fold metallo-hydrolase [Bacteroidota bacterium]
VKDEPFTINGVDIMPIHVLHLAMPILGYRIQNFAYITDGSFIAPKEMNKLHDLDTLVINTLGIKEHYSHFNLKQALAIIDELKPRQAFLTHISHNLGKYEDVVKILPDNVRPAYDTLSVEVGV